MTALTARRFERLERQAHNVLEIFSTLGYEHVAPPSLQPADVFLDVVGESLRGRTYVFTDADGEELCLRPDLTVPVCLLHLARHPAADVRARYSYNGSAFRFQPGGGDAVHPREFHQAGIENFGTADKEQAEADIVSHSIQSLRSCGLDDFKLHMGDLGLFRAVLASIAMPERWRQRLRQSFWRPDAFHTQLQQLASSPADAAKGLPEDLIEKIDPDDLEGTEQLVDRYLGEHDLEMIGTRTLREIANSLAAAAKDAQAEPLSADDAQTIQSYVGINGQARAVTARLRDLERQRNIDISEAVDRFQRRLDLLGDAGVDIGKSMFSAEFGRALEYYTGFVFEIESPLLGEGVPIVGGGRYDGLLREVGAPFDVPAVGAAIHTERLLDAVSMDAPEEDTP